MTRDYVLDQGFAQERARLSGMEALWDAGSRALLEELGIERSSVRLADVFDDGHTLYNAVCEHGLEGIVAKKRSGLYRPGYRGWTKLKNPGYWRRESEIEHMQSGRKELKTVSSVMR